MNVPAAERDARRALDAAAGLPEDGETQIILFAEPTVGEFDLRRVNPTQDVANKFRGLAASWARSLQEKTLVPYSPGRKLDQHEVAFLQTAGVDSIPGVLDSLDQPIDIPLFEDVAFARRLRFYVVAARLQNPWAYFFKSKGETLRLKRTRKVALVPSGGAYSELDSDPLVFDETFDAVVAGGYALVEKQPSFEKALRFVEQASAAARETLDQLLANVAIANAEDFAGTAATDVNMIAKLRSISSKVAANPAYAQGMTTERLIEFARERGIAVDTAEVDGEERFVFYNDPQRRFQILKLLDDDYLHSALTEFDYEVNSKTPM